GWPFVSPVVTLPLVAMADPWLVAICIIGLLALWPGGLRLRVVSRAMVVAAVLFLAIKGVQLGRVLRTTSILGHVPLTAVEAEWGSLTEWQLFERTPTDLRAWGVSTHAPERIVMERTLGADTPRVHMSRSVNAVRNFLAVHEFTFPVEK